MSNDDEFSVEFTLERQFPNISGLFKTYGGFSPADPTTSIVLDTNVLLLPYKVDASNLEEVERTLAEIADAGRLYLPARAAREFMRHRDSKLAELAKFLADEMSRFNVKLPKSDLLMGRARGRDELSDVFSNISTERDKYNKLIQKAIGEIKGWTWSDPVSKIYDRVFSDENIIEIRLSEEDLRNEWKRRLQFSIPPGNKDRDKPDTGIGDFLIWETILQLAEDTSQDTIFVTADLKSDWFVRSDGSPIFPRPELIQEYRARSKGRNIQFRQFHDLLAELKVSPAVVEQIATAESRSYESENDRHNLRAKYPRKEAKKIVSYDRRIWNAISQVTILPHGGGSVFFDTLEGSFSIEVSDACDDVIYVYPNKSSVHLLGKVNPTVKGSIGPDDYTIYNDVFQLSRGEFLVGFDWDGNGLVAKLLWSSSPDFSDHMGVSFLYYGAFANANLATFPGFI